MPTAAAADGCWTRGTSCPTRSDAGTRAFCRHTRQGIPTSRSHRGRRHEGRRAVADDRRLRDLRRPWVHHAAGANGRAAHAAWRVFRCGRPLVGSGAVAAAVPGCPVAEAFAPRVAGAPWRCPGLAGGVVTRRSAAEQAARAARATAIRACPRCDPCGWRLGPDGAPVDPATRCDHGTRPTPPLAGRDVTEPIHEPPGRAS